MKLTHEEKTFIYNNRHILIPLLEKRRTTLNEDIIGMKQGMERDTHILLSRDIKAWMIVIKNIEREREPSSKKNPI
jgi:hypothetical protein|tara:strand:- start:158 stop:385 length:228 start_codon:yes stop_codon:yes gene_type:complete